MEVVKIKIQSGELVDGQRKYRSTVQTIGQIVRDGGFKGLYTGLALTATRQATNQAGELTWLRLLLNRADSVSSAIFSTYTYLKAWLEKRRNGANINGWEISGIGFLSGVAAPCTNTPIDTIKTRLQRSSPIPGVSEFQRAKLILTEMIRTQGVASLYRGCLPRVLRAGPAQAVTFTVYERIKTYLTK